MSDETSEEALTLPEPDDGEGPASRPEASADHESEATPIDADVNTTAPADAEAAVEMALDAAVEAEWAVDAAVDSEAAAQAALDADRAVEAALDAEAAVSIAEDAEAAEEAALDAEAAEEAALDAEAAAEGLPADPYSELRDELEFAEGEWFVVQSYAGYERRVKANLEMRAQTLGLEDKIFQVEVPMETVTEIKRGERKRVERVKLAGYVLVRMDFDEDTWAAVRDTPNVTGFLGGHNPPPLPLDEVVRMLVTPPSPAEAARAAAAAAAEQAPAAGKGASGSAATTPSAKPAIVSEYTAGDVVTVIDGPFESLTATISEVNAESGKITAMVELFGRDTPVELRFDQIVAT